MTNIDNGQMDNLRELHQDYRRQRRADQELRKRSRKDAVVALESIVFDATAAFGVLAGIAALAMVLS